MSKFRNIAVSFIATVSLFAASAANSTSEYSNKTLPAKLTITTASVGDVLANSKGLSVYTFDKDQQGISKCYGPCASKWPPVLIDKAFSKGQFSTSERTDGSIQVRYQNKPLYLWVGDKKAGETKGDNIKNVWHIIKM